MAGKARPLRLQTRSISCGTLYAGQSFMEANDVKEEPRLDDRENIEEDLRAAHAMLQSLKMRARKLEALKEPGPVAGFAAPVDPVPPARPVATPARTEKPQRTQPPVMTDAQPRSYSFWEQAYPENSQETRDRRRSERASPEMSPKDPKNPKSSEGLAATKATSPRNSDASLKPHESSRNNMKTESFNQRMEIVIRNVKEGRVVIDSGFYSESAMKTELKFDKDRIKAVVAYCTKTKEEFSQYVEIIDNNTSLPNPVLGNEALPCYDEDIEKIPQILGEILKVRIKVDKTLEELKKKKKDPQSKDGKLLTEHGEQLMKLHDELAEIRADHNAKDPSKEAMGKLKNALATVEKLCPARSPKQVESNHYGREEVEEDTMKTVLRPVPKAKAKPAGDCDDDDESPDEEDVPQVLLLLRHVTALLRKPWHVLVEQGNVKKSILIMQMIFEVRDCFKICTGSRGQSTKTAPTNLSKRIHQLDVGHDKKHPVLRVKDFLQALAESNKLPLMWGSTNNDSYAEVLPKFWRRWKTHDPQHAVFSHHRGHMAQVLPLQLHGDEGETLKKTGVMILNWQSPIGFGLAGSDDSPSAMSLNYLGNSYATRFLYTVCHKKSYAKDKSYVLTGIVQGLAEELVDLFYNGVTLNLGGKETTFYAALLGLKGDWPIQARVGNLTRHFARKAVYKVSADTSGFCHLCRAGEQGYDANDYSQNAAWRETFLKVPPWTSEGPLCRVPQSPAKEYMHKFDIFHTLHKGVFAELSGSGLVLITDYHLAGAGDIPQQLQAIYALMAKHCKDTATPLHMDGLTRHLLSFPGDYAYPVGNWFKGADTAAACSFLEAFWSEHLAVANEQDLYLDAVLRALRAANVFLRTLYRSGLWLSVDRCKIVAEAGLAFLKAYLEASSRAYERGRTRFKLTPKYHALIHIIDVLATAYESNRRWTLNPLCEATQMDEDFVGRVANVTTAVNVRQMHKSTLRKYLTNVWTHLHSR
ncbi:unnamed protein product [Symbiodinium sp. CCMP2592]|nr:unnamed protein product [Symbiodinium sp. CCMP2592]